MSELLPILEALLDDARAGRAAALCTVVRTKGSTPQRPGAAMLVREDFGTVGTLGGGCVEAEVHKRAFEHLRTASGGVLQDFLLDHDYSWDDGLICGGRMYIAITPIKPATDVTPFEQALERSKKRGASSLPLEVEHEGKRLRYVLHLEASPVLLIAGAGHVGKAVAKLAAELDFHIVAIDDRPDFASADRFPSGTKLIAAPIAESLKSYPIDASCYVVIVTRGHRHDHQALEAVIESDAGYIGLIGSRRKSKLILKDLAVAGVAQERLDAVHTPIGLAIGAVTVPEIAVSIAAELVKVRRERTPVLIEGPIEVAEASGEEQAPG